MKKRLLKFQEYIAEQFDDLSTNPNNTTSTTSTTSSTTSSAPETEKEAKSRIAKGLLQNLFGDIKGMEDGVDAMIDQTSEVKQSSPYRGCGASEPYPLERRPMSIITAKILLEYLDSKGKGDYKRAIKEIEENRALVLGIRNKIEVKSDPSNNDRFTDALYLFPQGIYKETEEKIKSDVEKKAQEEKERLEKEAAKQKRLKDDPLAKIKAKSNKGKEESSTEEKVDLGPEFTPYQITTSPSLAYYGEKPVNPKGTGIKLPGDTLYYLKESNLGHGRYKMMVEGEPIDVARYQIGLKKYDTYKPNNVMKESTGMQIHRSSTTGKGICVGPWSAGCQVFDDINEFNEFIKKAGEQTTNSNKFIYALIQLDDIPDEVMEKALRGETYTGSNDVVSTTPDATGATGGTPDKDKPEIKRGVTS